MDSNSSSDAPIKDAIRANLAACKAAADAGDPYHALNYAQAAATASTKSIRDALGPPPRVG